MPATVHIADVVKRIDAADLRMAEERLVILRRILAPRDVLEVAERVASQYREALKAAEKIAR